MCSAWRSSTAATTRISHRSGRKTEGGPDISGLRSASSACCTLGTNPHVHCVVPAGGLSPDHTCWIRSHPRFFLPIQVLRRVFRGKFVAGLKSAFQHGQLHLSGNLALLAQPRIFAAWLRPLFRKDWIVYSKPPFGGPDYVLQYLGRYTHRVAISNHRLISLADGQVTFRWRDSAHHNEQKLMTLSLDGFLRRVLLHLLPKSFVRIRHVGFLANCRRSTLLPLCLAALDTVPSPTEPETSATQESHSLWRASEKALALSLERARAYPAARSKNFGLEQGRLTKATLQFTMASYDMSVNELWRHPP